MVEPIYNPNNYIIICKCQVLEPDLKGIIRGNIALYKKFKHR